MAHEDGRLEDEYEDLPETPEEEQTPKGYADYVEDEEPTQVTDEEEEDELPEKYRNKDVKDIIAMHQNAEKLVGKQSQEVGELRKIVDDFIKAQTTQATAQTNTSTDDDFDEVDFFEDPKKAVQQLVDNHPTVKQSQQVAANLAKQEALAKLKAQHPDFQTIVADSGFQEWVQKSKIRTDLLRRADQAFDYDSADELFSLWKERQGIVNDTVKQEKAARKKAVKSASTGSTRSTGERQTRKIYRRADIVDLMTKDPERYQALAAEIRQAYAEGRVR